MEAFHRRSSSGIIDQRRLDALSRRDGKDARDDAGAHAR